MKTILKYILLFLAGLAALVGLGTVYTFGWFFYSLYHPEPGTFGSDVPATYIGKDYLNGYAYRKVPMPEQHDPELPMVIESTGIDYTCVLIFRASADWQKAFCTLYDCPAEAVTNALDDTRNMAEKLSDKRILETVNAHEWSLFHAAHLLRKKEEFVNAYRDESGEYVLLYLYSF